MDEIEELDPLDKLAIISIAVAIFILSIVITSCFVIPCCCGYKCLHRGKKNEPDNLMMIEPPKKKISVLISDKNTPIYQSVGSHVQILGSNQISYSPQSTFNSNYAPTSFLPFSPVVPRKPPHAKLDIGFCSGDDAEAMGRISIHIIEVENVPQRDYPTLPDTTVVLEVLMRQWNPLQKERMLHRVQTRLVKAEASPMFDQAFTFATAKSDLKSWIIRLVASDEDKLTRYRETCSGRLSFKDIDALVEGSPCSVSVPMEPTISNLGQVLVTLSYLPTAQRLSVSIIKGSKLQWENVTPSLPHFHPYARVVLLDHAGRVLKKKKISGNSGTDSPNFSGSLCFQVSHTGFETATLLLVICSGAEKNRSSSEDVTEVPRRKDILGFAALGWMVNDETGRDHWRAILSKPRTSISQWHILR